MRDNTGMLIALAALVGLTGLCCVGGGAAFFLMRRADAPAPVAYPPPVTYAPPPTYVPPSYPPVPPSYPPSTGAVPTALLTETADTPVRGPVGAPITIHVISDFQCPFCSRVEPTLAQIDATYPGQIRWVWHDYPLPFHQDAMPAAEAAHEVRRQLGDAAFWTYHDQLFAAQRTGLDGRSLESMAASIPGIDLGRFRTALVSHEHEATIRAGMALVDAANGSIGTPTFQIGPTWISGAQPFESFRAEIDRQLGR
ncbi:MAG: thioredoxin domain-containing protein [Sandaracinus sp.]